MIFFRLFIMKVGQSLIAVPWRKIGLSAHEIPCPNAVMKAADRTSSSSGTQRSGSGQPASIGMQSTRDATILGMPNDMGTQCRPAPASDLAQSVRPRRTTPSDMAGAYDHEDDATYLPLDRVRIVDLGDTDVVHTHMTASHASSELAVRTIIERGGFARGTGGDHSINIPCIRAFRGHGPIHVVQIDAHLDFVDIRHRVREVASVQCAGRPKSAM